MGGRCTTVFEAWLDAHDFNDALATFLDQPRHTVWYTPKTPSAQHAPWAAARTGIFLAGMGVGFLMGFLCLNLAMAIVVMGSLTFTRGRHLVRWITAGAHRMAEKGLPDHERSVLNAAADPLLSNLSPRSRPRL